MQRSRPRARRSRYNVSYRLTRSVPAVVGALVLLVVIVTATLTYKRLADFVSATTGRHINPIGEIAQVVEPSPGTIAYKLKHGQQVNILLLGRGGEENDAPYLTDSIMAVTIDPASDRVSMVSIPRDLVVGMNLQSNPGRIWVNKINAAYEVPVVSIICCVASQYQGRDGPGFAAEHEVGKVTGLTFDRYIAVDFVAFRDMVQALGGVDICLSTNLDDPYYPDYHNGITAINFQGRLAIQMLAAGFEMDRRDAVVIVRVIRVVKVRAQADVNAAECLDHVAEGDEVDGDVAIEGQAGDLAHLMLCRKARPVTTLVLRGDAADDADQGNFVSGVDLVDPDPAWIGLQIHADHQIARDGDHGHAIGRGIDGHGHDRIGQVRRVVLLAAAAEQQDVDLLAVLQLVGNGAWRGLDHLRDLADGIDVPPGRGRDEVIEALVGEGRGDDHDQEHKRANDRRNRPGQAVGDVVAGSPGPWPGPLHAHGDSTLQVPFGTRATAVALRRGRAAGREDEEQNQGGA